ncbi:MAG: CHAP domain-containing protein [Treponema sp.]|nr:MAG: CHAP domain-containing protein [Treponema sp.]
MRLLEFVKKYNGQKVDFDGHYGSQCVDLFRQYCKDVLNIPHTGGVVGAKDLYKNYERMPKEKRYFQRFRIEESRPIMGDVIIFDATGGNKYGHVAIVVSANLAETLIFEQDGFKQDGAKLRVVDYSNALGFLRKRSCV